MLGMESSAQQEVTETVHPWIRCQLNQSLRGIIFEKARTTKFSVYTAFGFLRPRLFYFYPRAFALLDLYITDFKAPNPPISSAHKLYALKGPQAAGSSWKCRLLLS